MHTIYETEAFVLRSIDQSESDSVLVLFTKDLGKLYVKAKGVRSLSSKLRYSIQDYSFVKVSLVCGKQGWRLVNANLIESLFVENNLEKFKIIKNIFSLIDRIIHTESGEPKVFEALKDGCLQIKNVESKYLDILECIIVLKILNFLGYLDIDDEKIKTILYKGSEWWEFDQIKDKKSYLIKNINNSLKSSQMWF